MSTTNLPGGLARLILGLVANEEGRLDRTEVALRLPRLDPAYKGLFLEQLEAAVATGLHTLQEAGLVEEVGGLLRATTEAKRLLYDAGELRSLPTVHQKVCPYCGSEAVAYQGLSHGFGAAAPLPPASHHRYACLSCGRLFQLYSEAEHQ